jgi:hypothetical protein
MTRRDFLALAGTVPLVLYAPALALASPAPAASRERDAYLHDELPIQGLAGECSGSRPPQLMVMGRKRDSKPRLI